MDMTDVFTASEATNNFVPSNEQTKPMSNLPTKTPTVEANQFSTTTSIPSEKPQTSRPVKPLPKRRSTKRVVAEDELLTVDYRWLNRDSYTEASGTAPKEDHAKHVKDGKVIDEFEFDLRRLSYVLMTSPNYNASWFS